MKCMPAGQVTQTKYKAGGRAAHWANHYLRGPVEPARRDQICLKNLEYLNYQGIKHAASTLSIHVFMICMNLTNVKNQP